jgi:general secretion pathway protein K
MSAHILPTYSSIGLPGRRNRASGIALILVLLLLMLLIVIVYSLAYSTRVNLRLAQNRAAELKVTYLGKAGVEVAKALLKSDQQENEHDWLGDKWAEPLPPVQFEEATVRVEIVDEDRKVNINSLVLDKTFVAEQGQDPSRLRAQVRERIERAIASLDWPIGAARLAGQIEERVRSGDSATTNDSYPFLGRPFYSIDELLEVEGVELETLYGERPEQGTPRKGLAEVLAVASTGQVNINTAPKEVLMALTSKMTGEMAGAIADRRKELDGFKTLNDLRDVPGLSNEVIGTLQATGTTRSTVFGLTVDVRHGQMRRVIRCLLQRPVSEGTRREERRTPIVIPNLDRIRLLRWEEVR